jgi:hypothetical protein
MPTSGYFKTRHIIMTMIIITTAATYTTRIPNDIIMVLPMVKTGAAAMLHSVHRFHLLSTGLQDPEQTLREIIMQTSHTQSAAPLDTSPSA